MPYPPPILAINRTNADPQQDTHPADHNALALGVNDIVAELGTNPGGIYPNVEQRIAALENKVGAMEILVMQNNLGAVPAGAVYDVVSLPIGTRPFTVRMTVIFVLTWGFDGAAECLCDSDLYRNVDGVSVGGGHAMAAPIGRFANRVITVGWDVAAGGDCGCKGRITLQTGTALVDGSIHSILQPI